MEVAVARLVDGQGKEILSLEKWKAKELSEILVFPYLPKIFIAQFPFL